MYYITYNPQNNKLLDISRTEPINAEGTVAHFDEEIDLVKMEWNTSLLTFTYRDLNRFITKLAFLNKFTMQERIIISSTRKTDPIVEDIMTLLDIAEEINLDDKDTQQGVAYLVSIGLITEQRAQEILG